MSIDVSRYQSRVVAFCVACSNIEPKNENVEFSDFIHSATHYCSCMWSVGWNLMFQTGNEMAIITTQGFNSGQNLKLRYKEQKLSLVFEIFRTTSQNPNPYLHFVI